MGLFHHDSSEAKAHGQVNAGADLSTEMLAGAASYEAAKAFEVHVDEHGIPESHEKMQELVTGYVGNWIDEIVQARGVEGVDISLAKKEGVAKAEGRIRDDKKFGWNPVDTKWPSSFE